jgi:GTP cyclohydrolase II
MNNQLIWARFETPNFTFDVFAPTQEKCWTLLERAWKRHAKQSGADPGYLVEYREDVEYITIQNGTVLMDRQEYKS